MQAKMLEMLLYFRDFCQEHHLMFYLCGVEQSEHYVNMGLFHGMMILIALCLVVITRDFQIYGKSMVTGSGLYFVVQMLK